MDLSAFSLAGKTIMVTGANTGIGQGIALSIGRAGGRVIGVGRSTMDETAELMAAIGAELVAVQADLGSTSDAQAMFEAVWDRHGPIDGLVNNAGIIKRVDAVDFTEEDWDSVMDINLKTPVPGAQGHRGGARSAHRQYRLDAELSGRHSGGKLHRVQERGAGHYPAAGQ